MSLAERLGALQASPQGCAVCRWYSQLDEADRATFDGWLARGGSVTHLWRKCAATVDKDGAPVPNPLTVKRPRFSECINNHDRKGVAARVAE